MSEHHHNNLVAPQQLSAEHQNDRISVQKITSRERERKMALDEAALIMECCTTTTTNTNHHDHQRSHNSNANVPAQTSTTIYNLDGFNLIGVISDPRYFGPSSSTALAAPTTTPHTTASTTSSYFDTSYYYQSFESTLSSMTGQMEALNHVLEDWSRQITGTTTMSSATAHPNDAASSLSSLLLFSTSSTDDELPIPESQLQASELPLYLQPSDTSSLQTYVRVSGHKAITFYNAHPKSTAAPSSSSSPSPLLVARPDHDHPNDTADDDDDDDDEAPAGHNNANQIVDVSHVPVRFFQSEFDLTDPLTFQQLLLLPMLQAQNQNQNGTSQDHDHDDDDVNVIHNLLPLVPPDHFNTYLDTIELALLQQVRNNSHQFFIESQNFGDIQEMILSLIQQVKQLQYSHTYLESNFLQPLLVIPNADSHRNELQMLEQTLQRIEDLMHCQQGLQGVLSAHDDLTAIAQIQYGRQLLNGTTAGNDNHGDTPGPLVELRRLRAFQTVSDQLNQYELLVVTNLRDELIEMFLSWNSNVNYSSAAFDISTSGSMDNSMATTTFRTSNQERMHLRVKEILPTLQQCQALTRTKETYMTRLQDVIRMTVRTTVGEFAAESVTLPAGAVQSVAMGASAMTLSRFLDCLDLIFEQLLILLQSTSSVNEFLITEGLQLQDNIEKDPAIVKEDNKNPISSDPTTTSSVAAPMSPLASVIATASELISKSISELLRIRKDAHSLVTLSEMKAIWDSCITFANQIDKLSGEGNNNPQQYTLALRTTLQAQVKLFVERRHESNMSSLAAALDSERWTQCEVSSGRQDAVTRLCSGLSMNAIPLMKRTTTTSTGETDGQAAKHPELEVEGTRYKVVWSCLLLIEMILANIATAAHFQSIATNNVSKVSELLRLFNSRTTQLVLGAGAIHSHAKLKSINAKHLSLVTQCLGVVMAIIPHVRAGLLTQLPKKQHMLLNDLDQIRKEYNDHNEKVLNKFVSIIGGIVEHSLARMIPDTDFDERANAELSSTNTSLFGDVSCCLFLDGVATNIRKMHQVLFTLLPPDHLIDTFSRIFAFVDNKVPALFIAAANIQPVFQQQSNSSNRNNSPDTKGLRKEQPTFVFPKTNEGKRQFLCEIEAMTKILNGLEGVRPWDFAAINVIERQLEYSMNQQQPQHDVDTDSNPASETVSVSDDVLSTSGDGENTATDTAGATDTDTTDKEEGVTETDTTVKEEGVSSILLNAPSKAIATSAESIDVVPVESIEMGATACSSPAVDGSTAAAATDASIMTSCTATDTNMEPQLLLPLTDTNMEPQLLLPLASPETPPTPATSTTTVTTNGLNNNDNK